MIEMRLSTVEITDWGAVTHFHDGSSYGAHPHDTHHYHVAAHRAGYGDDIMAYCREHEVCHLLIEEWLHDRPSRVIWGLAHNKPLSAHEAAYEELGAQTLQKWLRANERPLIGGIPWDSIKREALRLLP